MRARAPYANDRDQLKLPLTNEGGCQHEHGRSSDWFAAIQFSRSFGSSPFRLVNFLHICRCVKPNPCQMEFDEAVVGKVTLGICPAPMPGPARRCSAVRAQCRRYRRRCGHRIRSFERRQSASKKATRRRQTHGLKLESRRPRNVSHAASNSNRLI